MRIPTSPCALGLVLVASFSVQEPDDERGCCGSHGDSGEHGAGCRHAPDVPLAPLPEDATAKERRLREIHETAGSRRHAFLSDDALDQMREGWEASVRDGRPARVLPARLWYAIYLLHHGQVEEAIEHFEGCAAMCASGDDFSESTTKEVLYRLGLAYFRLAEERNCIAYHGPESCIFPLVGGAVHVEKLGAQRALETMERILAIDPDYSEARWLLNVAHMAVGTYPDGVAEEYLYPPSRFESEHEIGRFADVAPIHGLSRFGRAGSVVVDDFDGDGRPDVLSCAFDTGKSLELHVNRGDGSFEDVTGEVGLSRQLGGRNLVQADVDGDGRLDVLVLRGAGLHADGEMPNSLLVQTEAGTFVDVTAEAGIELEAPTETAAFADVDLDGDLDLFIGYESWVESSTGEVHYPSKLYLNDGSGSFEDNTRKAGVANDRDCVGAAFGDVDGDGDPDLFLSNRLLPNRLYLNRGDGEFTDVAPERGVTEPQFSRSTFFFDPDNDGDLDLFVTYHGHAVAERSVADWYWTGEVTGGTPKVYENDGEGNFRDATSERGLERVIFALGAAYGDVDGDGWPDVYVTTGASGLSALWPNLMFRNDGGESFQDVTKSGGFGHLQKGGGVAFADLDADGDQDVFLQVGGFEKDDGFGDVLFANPGHGNHWLSVDLEGLRANRDAIGARVRVRIEEGDEERDVYAFVGAHSSLGGSPLTPQIGLGRAKRIVELEVVWPGGSPVQVFETVPLDTRVRIREGEADLEVVEIEPFRLGG